MDEQLVRLVMCDAPKPIKVAVPYRAVNRKNLRHIALRARHPDIMLPILMCSFTSNITVKIPECSNTHITTIFDMITV